MVSEEIPLIVESFGSKPRDERCSHKYSSKSSSQTSSYTDLSFGKTSCILKFYPTKVIPFFYSRSIPIRAWNSNASFFS